MGFENWTRDETECESHETEVEVIFSPYPVRSVDEVITVKVFRDWLPPTRSNYHWNEDPKRDTRKRAFSLQKGFENTRENVHC